MQQTLVFISLAAVGSATMIYPKIAPTPVTFICAIGIPVGDLPFETVISGYALRMQYFLPNNASEVTSVYLRPQPITDRGNNGSDFQLGSIYRWILYNGIEMILEKMSLSGHSCLLRLICEHAASPLNHESGLLGEVLHIILTPSRSKDHLSRHKDHSYLAAERLGRRGGHCAAVFGLKCKRSPLDLISVLV
ncbi:uncharacterized protein LOC6572519 [Drosophila mojavensis]|uniref:Uncharacterized protein n=1 Tax=Drosophila mojavensis TaxID=7230 RepID=B4K637_DROMO|nr:uncharacterized protein LOC6572519 [Drosophila mojavensis]EDW14087.2 uncharacterized protein Dmoj_GI23533 [Drosophila mojavensis]